MPTQLTLGPGEPFKTYDQERAIKRYLDSILVEKSKNKYKCINDFLIAKFPDVKGIEKGKNLINDKDLITNNLIQAFAPDNIHEAKNRGFKPF